MRSIAPQLFDETRCERNGVPLDKKPPIALLSETSFRYTKAEVRFAEVPPRTVRDGVSLSLRPAALVVPKPCSVEKVGK
jgi:hypothetical protein